MPLCCLLVLSIPKNTFSLERIPKQRSSEQEKNTFGIKMASFCSAHVYKRRPLVIGLTAQEFGSRFLGISFFFRISFRSDGYNIRDNFKL